MPVELWDDKYGNAIEEFADEDRALAFVRAMIEQCGSASVADWVLDPMDGRPMIRGQALVQRARAQSRATRGWVTGHGSPAAQT